MGKKVRKWFFGVPDNAAYDRLRRKNKPSEATLRHLLDSVAMFEETSDTASESQQGLTLLATNANVVLRTSASAGAKQTIVRPHQLPLMVMSDGTEADTIATAVESAVDGMKLTPVYNATSTRMNFKIEWSPYLINGGAKTASDVDTDMFVFLDSSDSYKPKLNSLADLLTDFSYWKRTGTVLSPKTAGDSVDLGSVITKTIGLELDNGSDRSIVVETIASGTQAKLTVKGGDNTANDGGKLVLKGGASGAANAGGDVNLYGGGTAGGTEGNTILGFSEGGAVVGKVAVGGAVDATYKFKVHHDTFIDGDIKATISEVGVHSTMLGLDATNKFSKRTSAQVMEFLLGSPSKGDMAYYDGASWSKLAAPGSIAHLKISATDVVSWDTTLAGATDTKVAMDAAANAGYLYDGGAGVLRLLANSGLAVNDAGDYMELSTKSSTLATVTPGVEQLAGDELIGGAYVSGYQTSNPLVDAKFPIDHYIAGLGRSGWRRLNSDTEYSRTAASISRLTMSDDLTEKIHQGMACKFKLSTGATVYFGYIEDITATHIDISGAPFTTGLNEIEKFWVGHPSKVVTEEVLIDSATYNTATDTALLENINNYKDGKHWRRGTAYCVHFAVIHMADDSSVQPIVNIRTGPTPADYVSTSNANKGLLVGTTKNETVVDIDPSKYLMSSDDVWEVKVDKNGGTGDADYLKVTVTFVLE